MAYRYPSPGKNKESSAEDRRREQYEEWTDQFAGSNFNDPNDPVFDKGSRNRPTGPGSGRVKNPHLSRDKTDSTNTVWETERSASQIMAEIQALMSGEIPEWASKGKFSLPGTGSQLDWSKKALQSLQFELWVSQQMRKSRGASIGTFKANLGYKLPVLEDEPTSTTEAILGVAAGRQSSSLPFTAVLKDGLF